MSRVVALTAALLGGIAWVTNLYVDHDLLAVAGLVLLALAVAAAASSLVRQPWLQLISAAGAIALSGSLVELLRTEVDDRSLEGVLGAAAALVVAIAVRGGPSRARTGNARH